MTKKLLVLMGVSILICSGCSYSRHSVDVVVSESTEADRPTVHRVGVVKFNFDRPTQDQLVNATIMRPANAGEIVADGVSDIPMMLGYEIIERRQLQALMDEQKLTTSELLKGREGSDFGKLLGIDAVLVGTVSEYSSFNTPVSFGRSVAFNARCVRLDGKVLWTVTCYKEGPEGETEMLRALCKEAAEKLSTAGAKR